MSEQEAVLKIFNTKTSLRGRMWKIMELFEIKYNPTTEEFELNN